MALATRNIYLVLKARDEASRVVRGFGRELGRAGALAQAQQLRQRASILQQEQAEKSLAATRQINILRNKATLEANRAAAMRGTGASAARIEGVMQNARALRAQAADLERANKLANKEMSVFTGQLRQQAYDFESTHRASVRFANGLHQISATLVTVGSGLALAGGLGVAMLFSAANAANEYARQVALTKTQVDGFDASLKQISDTGLKVARTIAVPLEEVQPALYDIFSSTSANLQQATILLEGFAKTAVAGQVSLQDATRGTIPILNAFNLPIEKVNDILDIQFQLVRKGVGTYGEFASVFGRVVPSATRAGQDFQEVAAGLAYLTRNGLSAAMASTSFARALDAISNPKSVNNMENLGIKVRDVKGNMLPLEQILKGLSDYLNKLPNADRVGALVDIFKGAGGTIQARRFLDQVLLKPGELNDYIGFLHDMQNANGQFGQAYATMSNTVAAQTQLLKNKFDVIKITVGQIVNPYLVGLLHWLNKIADSFNNLSPATQKWIVLGIALVSVLSIVGGVMLIVIGALAGIAAAVVTAGTGFFILVGAVAGLVLGLIALGGIFVVAYERSKAFRDIIARSAATVEHFWTGVIVPFGKAVKDAFEKYILPPLQRLADVIEQKVAPVIKELQQKFDSEFIGSAKQVANIVKDGLVEAFKMVGWVIDHVVKPVFTYLVQFYHEHKDTVDMVIHGLMFLGKWFAIIAAVITGLLLVALGGPIIAIITVFVGAIIGIGLVVIWLIDIIRDIIHWFKDWGEHWQWVKDKFKDFKAIIKLAFEEAKAAITDFFADAPKWLYDAGKHLLEGLINGIKDKAEALPGTLKKVAQAVKDFFPFSPAKKGPLSGQGSLYYAGQHLVRDLADGMASQNAALGYSAGGAALNAGNTLTAGASNNNTAYNQNINITTQEIDPKRHAMELGFLLAGGR